MCIISPDRSSFADKSRSQAAFANSLKAPGVELEEAQDGIPLVFHEIRRLLKPSKSSELAYDQEKIAGLLSGFAIKGNESTFVSTLKVLSHAKQLADDRFRPMRSYQNSYPRSDRY